MKSGRRPGFTLDLDDELARQLDAFKATYYAKTKRQIISEALIAHIEDVLGRDRERRARFMKNLAAQRAAKRAPSKPKSRG